MRLSQDTHVLYKSGLIDELYSYQPLSNRLTTQNGWTFARDAAGNRTQKLDAGGLGQLYGYGDHARLVQVTQRDTAAVIRWPLSTATTAAVSG